MEALRRVHLHHTVTQRMLPWASPDRAMDCGTASSEIQHRHQSCDRIISPPFAGNPLASRPSGSTRSQTCRLQVLLGTI